MTHKPAKQRASFEHFLRSVLKVERAVTLTAAQWVMVRVCFDGIDPVDLSEADQAIALELFGPVERVPPEARHVLALLKGARVGGTWLCSLCVLYLSLICDLNGLAPGEVGFGIICCPDMRLAGQAFRYVAGAIDTTPSIAALVVSKQSDSVTLRRPDGHLITIECLPASRGGAATRGRTLFAALLDELSFFRDADSGQVNDTEVYRSVVVRVLPGGKVLAVSTAWLESGLLFELVQKNHGHPTTALACIAPTLTMRDDARIRTIVEDERQRDQANAEREFDCKPYGGGSSQWIDSRAVAACVDRGRPLVVNRPRLTNGTMCVDLGFVANSSAASVVFEPENRTRRYVLGETVELKPGAEPLKPSVVCETFAQMARRHDCWQVVADIHYAETLREHLAKYRLGMAFLPAGGLERENVFTLARNVITEGRISLPDNPRLIKQLCEVTSRPKPGGGYTIAMPQKRDGSHGDVAASAIGAIWAIEYALTVPRRPTIDWDSLPDFS